MPTQRPFLSNFLAAFRTHTQPLQKTTPSITSSASPATAASAQTLWTSAGQATRAQTSEHAITSPRAINTKTQAYPAPMPQQDRQLLQHTVSPSTHIPRSPSSTGLPMYGPPNKPQPSYLTAQEAGQARRRGSDSSSDSGGFRDVRGVNGEKWFIGGRTAGGDEKYYKLSMTKRDRSADCISADQLSL